MKALASTTDGYSVAQHDSRAAGTKSATHYKGAEFHVVIRRDQWMPLMQSVADDLARQLRASGAEILDASGDARQGFRFQYVLGHTFGEAVIEPLDIPDPGSSTRSTPMSPADISVRLRVEVHEEWFKVKQGLMTVRIQVRQH